MDAKQSPTNLGLSLSLSLRGEEGDGGGAVNYLVVFPTHFNLISLLLMFTFALDTGSPDYRVLSLLSFYQK